MVTDYERDAWLAGFIDGEGCFALTLKRQIKAGEYEIVGVAPRFSIALRADDMAVLDGIAASMGGRVKWHKRADDDTSRRAPRYEWLVTGKADLLRLVEYLDRFPLRAKKARDYAIWRRATLLYCALGARLPELAELRDTLMGQREYREPTRLRSVA